MLRTKAIASLAAAVIAVGISAVPAQAASQRDTSNDWRVTHSTPSSSAAVLVATSDKGKKASAASKVGDVGPVYMTWHQDQRYVSLAWSAGSLEFAHFHVMIVARQTNRVYTYTYTGQSWANVYYTHFPPESSNHAGFGIYVYGTNAFGTDGPALLARARPIPSSQPDIIVDHTGTWADLVPALVKRCAGNGIVAAGKIVVGGAVVSVASSFVPVVGEVEWTAVAAAAELAGAGTFVFCAFGH